MSIVALIPAHNEQDGIEAAVRGLLSQTRRPDRIIVIADNCTDDTATLAMAAGAEVFSTAGNTAKKAGALNQALRSLLPTFGADAVLVQDADSELDPEFVEVAMARLNTGASACGGTFRGGPGGGFVGWLQRNEYARYARDVRRLKGKVLVLTGTATLFDARALRRVAAARGSKLPGRYGRVYDEDVLTEDNELTFAFLHLGLRFVSPIGCGLVTEVMPTWRALARQRHRWKRGALENLRQYGFPRWTWPYWGRQALSAAGVVVTMAYVASVLFALLFGALAFSPFWLGITAIFCVERAVTVRARGPRAVLAGAVLVVEMPYDFFLQVVQARAIVSGLLRTERRW